MGQGLWWSALRPEPSDDSLEGGTRGLKARGCRKNRWSGWHERESRSGPQGVRDKKESGTCVSSLQEWRIYAAYRGKSGQGADPTDEEASSLRVDHTGTQAQGDGVGS